MSEGCKTRMHMPLRTPSHCFLISAGHTYSQHGMQQLHGNTCQLVYSGPGDMMGLMCGRMLYRTFNTQSLQQVTVKTQSAELVVGLTAVTSKHCLRSLIFGVALRISLAQTSKHQV